MSLKKRMGMLRGVWGDMMPYRDPHTVGPAMWALRHRDNADFEVSVAVTDAETPTRKGLEALAISLYRQECGASPTFNFGRMPAGYAMSSGNNAKLVAAGKRFRGGPTNEVLPSHAASIAPIGKLERSVVASDWCGHPWSEWQPLSDEARLPARTATGLYRLRDASSNDLLYIGEGKIQSRLSAHRDKMSRPQHPQGEIFQRAPKLVLSFVESEHWLKHHRLELENDLIAAHVSGTGHIPNAQFLG